MRSSRIMWQFNPYNYIGKLASYSSDPTYWGKSYYDLRNEE